MADLLYNYGPPVTVVGNGAVSAQNNSSAVTVTGTGSSPHTPPAGTALVSVAGGSPTTESGSDVAKQSTVVGIAPTTATQAGGPLTVTVTGTKFVDGTTVIVSSFLMPTTYVSPTSVTAVVDRTQFIAGVKLVGVQTGAYKSNTTNLTLT